MQVPLADPVDIAGFHQEATKLLAQQVPPESVRWQAAPVLGAGGQSVIELANASIRNRAARAIIPQSFVRMSELVVLHRDPLRFELLYRSLWRLVYEPELKHDRTDADFARVRQMAQSVRRDLQKMKNRMQFHALVLRGAPIEVCWYEPVHFIGEAVANWLSVRRAAPWLLLTPDRCLRWENGNLLGFPGLPAEHRRRGADIGAWLARLESVPGL